MLKIIHKIVKKKGSIQNQRNQCIYCGKCQKVCPYHAITVNTQTKDWNISDDKCMRCERCLKQCPAKSLHLVKS